MRCSPAQTKKPRITRGFRGRPCRWPSLFLVLPPLLLVLVALLLFLLLLLLVAMILGILLALLGHGRSPEPTGGMPGCGNAVQRRVKDVWEKSQKFVKPDAAARALASQCLQRLGFGAKTSAYGRRQWPYSALRALPAQLPEFVACAAARRAPMMTATLARP